MKVPRAAMPGIEEAVRDGRVREYNAPPPDEPEPPEEALSEKQWMWRVIAYAESRGWAYYHVYDATMAPPGWPDLVLVRDRVVYAELKMKGRKPTRDQQTWIDRFRKAGQEVHVWRPDDWDEVRKALA